VLQTRPAPPPLPLETLDQIPPSALNSPECRYRGRTLWGYSQRSRCPVLAPRACPLVQLIAQALTLNRGMYGCFIPWRATCLGVAFRTGGMPGGHRHQGARAKVQCNDPYRGVIRGVVVARPRVECPCVTQGRSLVGFLCGPDIPATLRRLS